MADEGPVLVVVVYFRFTDYPKREFPVNHTLPAQTKLIGLRQVRPPDSSKLHREGMVGSHSNATFSKYAEPNLNAFTSV